MTQSHIPFLKIRDRSSSVSHIPPFHRFSLSLLFYALNLPDLPFRYVNVFSGELTGICFLFFFIRFGHIDRNGFIAMPSDLISLRSSFDSASLLMTFLYSLASTAF